MQERTTAQQIEYFKWAKVYLEETLERLHTIIRDTQPTPVCEDEVALRRADIDLYKELMLKKSNLEIWIFELELMETTTKKEGI